MPKANEYRCSVGGEWKILDAFSKSQQRRGKLGDHKNSGMICMEHSQPVRAELTCAVCYRARVIDEFSPAERKSDDPRCRQCVAWDTEQEYGIVPIQLATGHVSIEEPALRDYSAPTNTAVFFEPETLPGAPITSPQSLGLMPNETMNRAFFQVVGTPQGDTSSVIGNSETSAQVTIASHSETASVVNENRSTASGRLPPHLRGRLANHTSSATSSQIADPLPEPHTLLNKSLTMDQGPVTKSVTSTTTVGMTLPPHLLELTSTPGTPRVLSTEPPRTLPRPPALPLSLHLPARPTRTPTSSATGTKFPTFPLPRCHRLVVAAASGPRPANSDSPRPSSGCKSELWCAQNRKSLTMETVARTWTDSNGFDPNVPDVPDSKGTAVPYPETPSRSFVSPLISPDIPVHSQTEGNG